MEKEVNSQFNTLEEEIFKRFLERNPTVATSFGVHTYDDRLPKHSRTRHLKDIELRQEWKTQLEAFDPADLSQTNEMARKLGLHWVELNLFKLKQLRQWEQNPSAPDVIGHGLFPLLKREFAPLEKRLKSLKGRIQEIPRVLEEEKTKIIDPVKLWVETTIDSAKELPHLLEISYQIAKDEENNPEWLENLHIEIKKAKDDLKAYVNWLQELKTNARESFAIGQDHFEALLEKRNLGYSPQELVAMGKRLLQTAKDRMDKYAARINSTLETKEVLEQVKSNTPSSFRKALQWYRQSLQDAREFLIEHDLATLPANEEIEVTTTPKYLRPIIAFAAYVSPAKFDPVHKGIYLVTPPQKKGALQKHSYWDVRNTSVHEGYPGHHLQLSAALTNDDKFRLLTHATEMIEGWAHYCEEMMKEHGFDPTPEAKLLQQKDIVWRAARIILDVKLSTGKITFNEAVDFLMDTVGMDEKDAIAEVRIYTQRPSDPLSYLLGKQLIKDLKQDVKRKMGDKFTEKFFHDTILYAGSVPITYLREIFEQKMEEK